MRTKAGVRFVGIKPEMVFAALICASVFDDAKQKFTVTSVCEGTHMPNSLHYCGAAFDIRIFDLRGVSSYEMARRLQDALGSDFQVVVESDHLHVECCYEKTSSDELGKI